MPGLIEELKLEHRQIMEALDQVWDSGIDTPTGVARMMRARDSLLAHLHKEENLLYPKLRHAAMTDESLRDVADNLAKDIDNIYADAVSFFQKFATGEPGLDFMGDFSALYARINVRIMEEEEKLYALYDRLCLPPMV